MHKSIVQRYAHGANWLLIFYLSFMISGCSYRPAELSPEEARILQTRDFNGSTEEVAKAVTEVLQEMHYTLGNVDMGLGIITAERNSERRLAPISRESMSDSDISDEVGTFCLIAGAMAVVGIFLAWVFGGFDDDDEDNEDDRDDDRDRNDRRHFRSRPRHHRSSTVYVDSDSQGPDSYHYAMTINLEEISLQQTRVHVTVQGQRWEGLSVAESGPVQAQDFYIDFFNRLQFALNR